ncbi:MAG: hypothetical protein ISS25_01610 [Nanoarchaeota archaeon]|nr:hypothetical protein [DPANN group archaeon]MBL7116507.1 hypothetical protein [Nanoarchaeota archaeon]
MNVCVNCGSEYKMFMFSNYNLGLCKICYEKFKKQEKVVRDEWCDEVAYRITCPKCKRIYYDFICDEKCITENCDVWFFWDGLDGKVFAKWLKEGTRKKSSMKTS